jgi:hypothetical protein
MRDLKGSPLCSLVFLSGGLLRRLDGFVADISGHRIGPYPTFKLKVSKNFFIAVNQEANLSYATIQMSEGGKFVLLQFGVTEK